MRKRPRDPNQLAKLIVDIAVGDVVDEEPQPEGRARWGTPAPLVLRERGPDETAPG